MPKHWPDPAPDLFAAAIAVQKVPGEAEVSPITPPIYVLPKDLPSALRNLHDSEIDALLAAVTDEAKRRGRLPPQNKTTKRPSPSQTPVGEEALALGKANAVRAAFAAGIKPTTIARQFGISQSAVRQVLAAETKPKL